MVTTCLDVLCPFCCKENVLAPLNIVTPAVLGVAYSSCAAQLMKGNALTCDGSTAFRDVSARVYLKFICSLYEAEFHLL